MGWLLVNEQREIRLTVYGFGLDELQVLTFVKLQSIYIFYMHFKH